MPRLLLKLILCLAFISWTIWYGKTYFYRDPGSIFYDEVHAFEQRYSLHRRSEVDAFIRLQNTTLTTEPPIKSGPNPTLCLAFSSVRRQTSNYLEVRWFSLSNPTNPKLKANHQSKPQKDLNSERPRNPDLPRAARPPRGYPHRRTKPFQPP